MSNIRVEQMQKYLAQHDLDAALLCLSENVILMCRSYWSRNGLAFVFVPRRGEAVLIVPKPEAEDVPADIGLPVRRFGFVDLAEGNAYDNVAGILAELGKAAGLPAKCRIGIERSAQTVAPSLCDGEVMLPGAATMGAVKKAWPQAELADIMPAVLSMRRIKTPADIERIERVNRLAYAGLQQVRDTLDSGAPCTELSLAVQVESYIALHAGEFGIKYARAWAQVTSGPRTVDAWNSGMVTTSRPIASGEPVMVEMGTAGDGYFCDLTLTCCKGPAGEDLQKLLDAVQQAQQAALRAVRPGAKGRDVDGAARECLEKAGYGKFFNHGTGHGTGFAYHDGIPALNPSSEDVLEAGMIHSVEPGVYVPGVGGVRLELNALVTENGSRVLGK